MTCPEVRDHLSAWLDGELTPAVVTVVERHLESCAGCRRELAQLEALEQSLAGLPLTVPQGLPEKVRERLRRPRRRSWQSLALVASVVMGIALGGALARDFYAPTPAENGLGSEVASLEAFHDFPQGSMGMILASYQEDEVNGTCK